VFPLLWHFKHKEMNMLIKRYDFVFKWLKFLGAIVIAILLPARPLPKLQEYYLTNMPF